MNDFKDKIAIIVPFYNVEKYIFKCLKSIQNQSYNNIEVILIDDGSTDESKDIAKEFALKDSRFKLFAYKHCGNISKVRNIGLSLIRTKYFTFIDSDDIVESDFIKELYYNLLNYNCELSICSYKGQKKFKKFAKQKLNIERYDNTVALQYMLSEHNYAGNLWNKMFCFDVVKKYNLHFNEKIYYGEDLYFCFFYISVIKNVVYTNQKHYHYIKHKGSICFGKFNDKKKTVILAMNDIIKNSSGIINECAIAWRGFSSLEMLYNFAKYKCGTMEEKSEYIEYIKKSKPFIKKSQTLNFFHKFYFALGTMFLAHV